MHQKDDHKNKNNELRDSSPDKKGLNLDNETQDSQLETPSGDSRIDKLQQELEQSHQAQANALAQSQRALADYANLKKRFDKERQDLAKFAAESVVVQLLPSLDNLERALQYTSPDEQKG